MSMKIADLADELYNHSIQIGNLIRGCIIDYVDNCYEKLIIDGCSKVPAAVTLSLTTRWGYTMNVDAGLTLGCLSLSLSHHPLPDHTLLLSSATVLLALIDQSEKSKC